MLFDTSEPLSALSRFLRFVCTGVLVNGILLVVLWLMLRIGIQYQIATTIGYVMGLTWGFMQNRAWSFRSDAPIRISAGKYLLTYLTVYFIHVGFVTLLVERVQLDPFLAAIVSMMCLLIPIFVVLDQIVFKNLEND